MTLLRVFIFLFTSLTLQPALSASKVVQTNITADRYTDLGNGAATWEQGTLFVANGYIPITNLQVSVGAGSSAMTSDVLTAISGKPVIRQSEWLQLTAITHADWSKFQASNTTYDIGGVPYLLINVRGTTPPNPIGTSDELLNLSISGLSYCSDSKPLKLSPKTSPALWLHIDDPSSVTLYGDQAMTETIATLAIKNAVVASNRVAWSGIFVDADRHLSLQGVFSLDKTGAIQSLKATMIQDAVLDTCFSTATVTGKKIKPIAN